MHGDVVKPGREVAGQGGHPGAVLDLKHVHGIGLLKDAIDLFVFGELCQIDLLSVVLPDKLQAILVSLGVMFSPLSSYVKKPPRRLLEEHHSLSEEWFSWCKRWFETSTLRPATRRSHFYRVLEAGRWLQA